MEPFKRINRELIHKGAIIDYYKDTMEFPNGNTEEWDMIVHKGAAAVLPILPDGNLLLVRQYRPALGRFTLEIPAGGLNGADEPTMEAASRELQEETGYTCGKIELLNSIYTTVAFCNEKIDIYLATDLTPGIQHLDENEFVTYAGFTLDELKTKIFNCEIQDSKTICAILTYAEKFS